MIDSGLPNELWLDAGALITLCFAPVCEDTHLWARQKNAADDPSWCAKEDLCNWLGRGDMGCITAAQLTKEKVSQLVVLEQIHKSRCVALRKC